jgi:hypothetical protein
MYKLFTDKTELFECNIKLEGASLKKSHARLLIESESEDIALVFKGTITTDGKCKIPVKKLKGLLPENTGGNIKLEVIAEDTYFTPWESKFTVDAARKITVEVKSQQAENLIMEESSPKVSVSNINESVSIYEREHIVRLLRLLIKEDINLNNLSVKKDKLNNLIGTYLQENSIDDKQNQNIIEGLLKGLSKIK